MAAAEPDHSASDWLEPVVRAALAREPQGWSRPVLVVRVDQQRLYVWENGKVVATFPISTAERGTGNQDGSLQTPLGLHRVARRIGDGVPCGTIFRGRVPTGQVAPILREPGASSATDAITSRILWLEGLEPGRNHGGSVDSFARYIYLHGTDEEGRIGTPASHGCIRLRNQDMIALFARVPLNSLVEILETFR
nr:L,D-transpeptidase [Thioalkalivibrio paradoxus]